MCFRSALLTKPAPQHTGLGALALGSQLSSDSVPEAVLRIPPTGQTPRATDTTDARDLSAPVLWSSQGKIWNWLKKKLKGQT